MVVDGYVLGCDLEQFPSVVVLERGNARYLVSTSDGAVRHEYVAE